MLLNDYMNEHFPQLILRPPLFYNGEIGIRFDLGSDNYYEENNYMQEVYQRAITLFESLHFQDEEIFIVVDVNDFGDSKTYKHKARIYSPYIRSRSLIYTLKHTEMPYIFPEDNEEGKCKTNRFTLQCKVSDVKYIPLLKALCNQDLGIQPNIIHMIYFINIKRKTIFHIYDDRGCDLLATSSESIRDIYFTYNDWILDYDRDEIDKVFK
ncbi:DUF3885 domain-containing protein [Lysinibacillus irui]|uniref:DUF3885 domain-containing protein n=1 Tax=Lysinibacillus irui TaxID=2998077 RepID=A0ABU5NI06_9BACI|nr:DUF3885 domain-containing protein [Lysinibacillus irui]MEA0553079.1 DUF3885 domain-containing protein [Lysinibacillus irui]MEA0975659.1 DUF3885 domain-containing protein [Lysinibacillus irui]MEA1041813.1 DUF3885 domain-containing protein [Lysinibacillus irui]